MPSVHLRISQEQLDWLDSQVKPYRTRSVIIRDLIDLGIKGVDNIATLSAYHVGAGTQQGNLRSLTGAILPPKQPRSVAATEDQPLEVAVTVPAQKVEPKKHNVVKKVENAVKSRAKRAKGTPEFEAFWKRYQACRHRANGQSKPKAVQVWQQLIADETQPETLMRALSSAIDDIQTRQGCGEFASPLPDCFRWLRDECYATYLEDNTPEQRKPSWKL